MDSAKGLVRFNVGVVGSGYLGLVTGACLSHLGHWVVCVDKDPRLVTELAEGRMPIYEPGPEALVEAGVRRRRLRFSTEVASPQVIP